jgi:hypothetical protein
MLTGPYETREYAKPLVAVYIDACRTKMKMSGSHRQRGGFGAHDAYAALSLDDGATWKRTNLSSQRPCPPSPGQRAALPGRRA